MAADARLPEPWGRAALVFIADDDDAVRRSLEMLLDGAGYRVGAFASGEAMIAGLEGGEPPACAVVDVRMGDGMTGLDVQRTLAARPGPAFPVIIVTGHADVPLAVAAMRLGVANFIEKPYPPDSLLDAVAEAGRCQPRPAARPPAAHPAREGGAVGAGCGPVEQGDRPRDGHQPPHGGGAPGVLDDPARCAQFGGGGPHGDGGRFGRRTARR